uniref:Large ribosomal subunit protein mL49 n=1 Tax=Lotharella globosa TaxID=91324 RepID=A0A7S3ZCL9_9EUKA|mmetsp:Transcript_16302/g.33062  ORF Transcript_16302/g.33062 Transcript_16302/m.33062 type:complete len:102 (+) Transcript_16302:1-306(+)
MASRFFSVARRRLLCTDAPQALAFKVERTKTNNLPVYLHYKKGRTRCVTVVKKYRGDVEVLKSHIQSVVGRQHEILTKAATLEIVGDHKKEIDNYLEKLGF